MGWITGAVAGHVAGKRAARKVLARAQREQERQDRRQRRQERAAAATKSWDDYMADAAVEMETLRQEEALARELVRAQRERKQAPQARWPDRR